MTAPNTVGYSAGAVCCPGLDNAMRRRERGAWVTWWNTGAPHDTRPYWRHVGQMVAAPGFVDGALYGRASGES